MIRQSLIDWMSITEKLLLLLNDNNVDSRDYIIEQVQHLLNEREKLQENIQKPFTDYEKEYSKKLLQLEEKLDYKLKSFSEELRKEMRLNKKKKTSITAYLDPYNQVFRDGTFYDKRK